jgi:hypothetical protein
MNKLAIKCIEEWLQLPPSRRETICPAHMSRDRVFVGFQHDFQDNVCRVWFPRIRGCYPKVFTSCPCADYSCNKVYWRAFHMLAIEKHNYAINSLDRGRATLSLKRG